MFEWKGEINQNDNIWGSQVVEMWKNVESWV